MTQVAHTIDELADHLRPVLSFELPDDLNPYDSLRDRLDLDSIGVFELIVVLESVAGCVMPPEHVPEIDSLADAFEYYWKCVPVQDP